MLTIKPHSTTPADDTVHSASQKTRRMAFVIWNFFPMETDTFRRTVDSAAAKGFTTVRLHLAWHNVEKQPLRYDFRVYDEQIAYIKEKGLDVILTVDLQRRSHMLDGQKTPCDLVMNTDEFQYPFGKDEPYVHNCGLEMVMISYASRRGTDCAVRFYRDTVRHFAEKFGDTIYAAFPTFTPYCETEYWCADDFDYSDHMRRAFTTYLEKTYRKIKDLNLDLGTSYESFEDVPMPPSSDRGTLGILFYQCRHRVLKAFIDRLGEAHKNVAPDTLFAVQFGCVWDGASVRRCTYGFRELSASADLVVVDDAPKFDHAYSMDYIASAFAGSGKEIGNEIDGHYMIRNGTCTAEDYIEQGVTSYRHNATMLYVANWYEGDDFDNNGYIFSTIADEYITAKEPFCVSEDITEEQPLDISLRKLFETGDGNYYQSYYRAYTASGAQFGRMNLHDDLTTAVFPNSVEGKKAPKIPEPQDPASPAVIFRRKARAAAMATVAVASAIVILAAGAAAKILLSDEDE